MAITKTSARVACPLFAGRGLLKGGFTMALPYKTFLSCEPSNIASERSLVTVFNYDLAEYVYDKAADVYAFGIYAETGAYTDAITDAKHIYAFKCFLKVSEDYSLGSGERHNADVRAASVVIEATDSVSGVVHGMYLNTRLRATSGGSTFGGYYYAHTPTYGGICLEARTEIIGESAETTTVGAAAFGYVGILVAHKSDRGMTGAYAGIAIHLPYEGVGITGTTYGIRFDDLGIWTGTAFDIGIDFADSRVVTAIDIGDVTTGILFTGTATIGIDLADETTTGIDIGAVTTGINFSGTVTTVGINMAANVTCPVFMALGTWGNDINWDQAQEFIEVLVETTSTTASKPMTRFRLAGHASTAHTGELCAVQIQTYQAASNVTDMIGLKVESGFKAAGTLLSGGTYGWIGLLVRLEDMDFKVTGTGNAYVAELRTQMFDPETVFNGESSFLHIINLNDAVAAIDSVFYLEQGNGQAGVATYLIDLDATVVPWNDTNKNLAIRVVSTAYYIPTGTSTIGLTLIAAYTDGIKFTGACTDCIEFAGGEAVSLHWSVAPTTRCITVAASLVLPEFLNIGTWGNEVQWDGEDEFIDILVETTKVDGGKPMIRIRLEGDNDADMTTGNLIPMALYAYGATTFDIYSMCGLRINTGIKGASAQLTGGLWQGIEVKLEDLENDLTQAAGAIAVNMDLWQSFNAGTTMGGDLYWFRLYKSGSLTSTYADAIFRFQDQSGGGIATYLISFNRTIASNCSPFASGDLVPAHDPDSGSIGADAYIAIDLGGTPYYIALYDTTA